MLIGLRPKHWIEYESGSGSDGPIQSFEDLYLDLDQARARAMNFNDRTTRIQTCRFLRLNIEKFVKHNL